MASFLSHLSPVPTFPAYTGPYKVGTQEVEIPVSDLSSPSPAPDPSISTISFRIFYPCEPVRHPKPVYWLPTPQSQYFRAYARFLNASPRLAAFLSYLPIFRTIFYTTIPALRDAKIAVPPDGIGKWPLMIFSHGLGGSRNAYSHITGSLASHGMVVVAAEHRDGSAPITFIRNSDRSPPRMVDYVSLPHKTSPEVEEKRNEQLKIRLWELGLIHDALLKIADGEKLTNIATDVPHNIAHDHRFASLLDVHTPGKISWCGHSFGAATVVQFIKSVYYPAPLDSRGYEALYTPSSDSMISRQITSSSPVALLDLWALPLQLKKTSWLLDKPMPAYQSADGSAPLAILSEAFFKWTSNLQGTKEALSPPAKQGNNVTPLIFYPISSAHLSQSDFGPLFPWLTRKVFKAENPERTLRLNVRAILENLRRSGVKIADTSEVDMELSELGTSGAKEIEEKQKFPLGQDHQILAADGSVKGWVSVPLSGRNGTANANGHAIEASNPKEAVMEGEVMKD